MHVPSLGLHNRYPSYKWQHFDNFGFLTHLIFWLNQKKKKKGCTQHLQLDKHLSALLLRWEWNQYIKSICPCPLPEDSLPALMSLFALHQCNYFWAGKGKQISQNYLFQKQSQPQMTKKKKKKNLDKDLEAFLNWSLEKKLKHWMTSAVKSSKTIKKFLV